MERTEQFVLFQTWLTDGRGYGTNKGQNKKKKTLKLENELSEKSAYLESLQTTACCGGALPTLVTLHAAVQTTAVVRLIQTLRLLKNNSLYRMRACRGSLSCRASKPACSAGSVGHSSSPTNPSFPPQSDPLGPDWRNRSKMTASCPSASPPGRERPEWVKKKRKVILTSYPRNLFQSWDCEIHLALVTKWTLPHWWGLINRLALNGI